MTLTKISKKLIKNTYRRYLSFIFSICFSVAMIGSFGVLLFSSTVTSVLIAGGTTYIFALGMFFITILGMAVFLIYSNSVFFKYKLDEIGVLLSLGMNRDKIAQMTKKEFLLLVSIGSGMGLALIIPVSWLFWTILSMFFTSYEATFHVGWHGIWLSSIFIIIMWFILVLMNNRNIYKLDIIKIVRSSATIEEVRGDSFLLGAIGFICLPLGLIMFNVAGGGTLSVIYLAISMIGLYLFTIQITLIGNLFKKLSPKMYYKDILFFNLMKQKGKQYTLSLFISTILIALCVFGICFNSSIFIDSYFQIQDEPFDGSLLVNQQCSAVDAHMVEKIAFDHGAELKDLQKITMLLVGRKYVYADYSSEWSYDFLISENDASAFLSHDISIPSGMCKPFDDSGMSKDFSTFYGKDCIFYNPTTKEEFSLLLGEGISGEHTINRSKAMTRFVILNESDFNEVYSSIKADYVYQYYLFNINPLQNAAQFNSALINAVISESNGAIYDNQFNAVIKDIYLQENIPFEDKYVVYKGNELYVARNWSGYPFIRNTAIANLLEESAVYIMLLLFISIVSFVCASMIIGIKIMSSLWQDQTEYQKASFIGLSNLGLSRLITKQISLIYLFPSFTGCATAVFMIYNIITVSSVKNVNAITIVATLISLCILSIQAIFFFFIRKKILSKSKAF